MDMLKRNTSVLPSASITELGRERGRMVIRNQLEDFCSRTISKLSAELLT